MDIAVSVPTIACRTEYDEKHDLLQFFRGYNKVGNGRNMPIDYQGAGLAMKVNGDIFHMDIPFSVSTDEATPMKVNGVWLGANHGAPYCVEVTYTAHGLDSRDIGSLWQDKTGMRWTIMKIVNEDAVLFLSDNIGKSKDAYAFCDQIAGTLTYISHGEHTASITTEVQRKNVAADTILRHTERELFAYRNGEKQRVWTSASNCDYAEIIEEYEVINIATVGEALRANRPAGGYTCSMPLNVGDPLVRIRNVFTIESDGTILVDFKMTPVSDANIHRWMGIMYQEKCDVGGGSIFRYIPKLKPFVEDSVPFDFSLPRDIWQQPFPRNYLAPREDWENPDLPPDRQIDFIRHADGTNLTAFAGGFLPVLDGKGEIRKHNTNYATNVYVSRKTYPIFADGDYLQEVHGIAYKKYYRCPDTTYSVYRVPYGTTTYVYVDLFAQNTVTVPYQGTAKLLEQDARIVCDIQKDGITVSGPRGYAVLEITQ